MNKRELILRIFDFIFAINLITRTYDLIYGNPNWFALPILCIYFLMRLNDLRNYLQDSNNSRKGGDDAPSPNSVLTNKEEKE